MKIDTYEKARNVGVYRDYYAIILTNIEEVNRFLAIRLLERGLSVEEVYKAAGLSKKEHTLKNKRLWKNINIAIDNDTADISTMIRMAINERVTEIASKLVYMEIYCCDFCFSIEDISKATGLSTKKIEKLYNKLYNEVKTDM